MSRLYASIDSDARKTQATSRGHKNIEAHVRGWDTGVAVRAMVDSEDRDVFYVYATGGSNDGSLHKLVATIVDGQVVLPVDVQYPIDRAKAQEGFTE